MHTPDSSRYWIASSYEERFSAGLEPENVDKVTCIYVSSILTNMHFWSLDTNSDLSILVSFLTISSLFWKFCWLYIWKIARNSYVCGLKATVIPTKIRYISLSSFRLLCEYFVKHKPQIDELCPNLGKWHKELIILTWNWMYLRLNCCWYLRLFNGLYYSDSPRSSGGTCLWTCLAVCSF